MITLRISLLLTIFLQLSVFAQKNVTDVTKSELTGISLPVGSKQDKRMLMTASAKALLDMKAKEIGRECSGSTEVIFLPPGVNEKQSDVVKKAFTEGGYKISEDQGDKKYSLIIKGDKSWLLYLDDTKSGADLYVSLLASVPVTSSQPASNGSASPTAAAVTNAAVQPAAPASQVVTQNNPGNTKAAVNETSSPAAGSAFKFTTTNFDDGWVAVETADYVKVTKGNIVSRIYFTVTMTDQMRPPVTEPHFYFWDLLVVPSFTIVNKWEWTESVSYFQNYYIYAEAIDRSTGRNCFIGLDIALNSGGATPVMVIAPDKTTYDALFQHPDNFKKMTGYNRFAIAPSDLTGTWSGSDGAAANYYNSVTGSYAGMGFVSMSDQFTFKSTGDYSSKHSGASGMVGSMNTYNQEYKGKATVSDWEIILNNRWKVETDTFEAWFEAVKGGRVLKLVNKTATGIKYNLVRINKD